MTTQSILAIDDSPDIHELLAAQLRPENLIIHHAIGAHEGLRMARELQPDLVLLDVDMPAMSGYDVCRRLKDDPQTCSLPVIFLSGDAESGSKVQGLDLGAVDYITKPFDSSELRARVRAALRTRRYHELLSQRAQLDGLTGLWNRSYFDRRLAEELAAARRYGRRVGLILIDIDHFKKINDTYGHPVGDQVLQAMGELLHTRIRTTDAACRYGGEEFAVVLSETDGPGARRAADRVQEGMAILRFHHKGRAFGVTASIGLASASLLGAGPPTAAQLITAADEALYTAKQTGRNRICESSPLEARIRAI
ncbi:MAG: diguanylate cyclase [Myxococcales bacterium]|nr:diguanylate cyclase [Myxococcales bacterium]